MFKLQVLVVLKPAFLESWKSDTLLLKSIVVKVGGISDHFYLQRSENLRDTLNEEIV